MPQAVDSFGIHTPMSAAALKAGGYVGALRYHYNTSRLEVDTLHAAGLAFGLIAEFDTRTWHPPVDSPETGPDHARKAVGVARNLGMPAGCVIWLTIDTAPNGRHDRVRDYFTGAAPIIRAAGYRVGAYGGDLIVDELMAVGLADLSWIAGAASWSERHRSTTACLRQLVAQPTIGGVTVDLNDVLKDDCGWWMPDGSAQSAGPGQPQEAEDDMPNITCVLKTDTGKRYLWDGVGRPVPAADVQIQASANLRNGGSPLPVLEVNEAFVTELLA